MTFLDFYTLLANMITAAQASSAAVLDTSVGSIARALFQATGSVVLWLQSLIAQLLQQIRAATAVGPALDSWMADFGLTRIGAVFAKVSLTFARFTTGASAFIPVGKIAQTSDGSVQFAVVADPTNPAFSPSLNGYTIGTSISSINVAAQSITPGATANLSIGSINTLAQAIPFVDTVINAAAASGGADAESDMAFRLRFVQYIASLAKATLQAITYAASTIGPTIKAKFTELFDLTGVPKPGYFYGVVDDGSGATPSSTIAAVYNAVDAVRAFGIAFNIVAATTLGANVSVILTIAPSYDGPTVRAAVTAAIQAYINSLGVAATLQYNQLIRVIFNASAALRPSPV